MFNTLGGLTATLPAELSVVVWAEALGAFVAVVVGEGVADAEMTVSGLLSLLAGVEQAANVSKVSPVTTEAETIGISFFMIS
jgi:hypothetical protein